jgi:hypothetical protein
MKAIQHLSAYGNPARTLRLKDGRSYCAEVSSNALKMRERTIRKQRIRGEG